VATALDGILETNGGRRNNMRQKFVLLVATVIAGCVLAGTGVAAGATEVDHFTDGPFPDEICGVTGTTTVHGTAVFRDLSSGGFFASGTFWAVFTADNGKSITIFAAGPAKSATAPVIDEAAGTVTTTTTFVGLPEKLSITHGRTLLRDVGIVTITAVFEYTGNPDEPFGDLISQSLSGLHGPHPDLLSDFEAFCDVLGPYLLDP
jgi:hypothetical protein